MTSSGEFAHHRDFREPELGKSQLTPVPGKASFAASVIRVLFQYWQFENCPCWLIIFKVNVATAGTLQRGLSAVFSGGTLESNWHFWCKSSWDKSTHLVDSSKKLDDGFLTGFCHVGTFKNLIRHMKSLLNV